MPRPHSALGWCAALLLSLGLAVQLTAWPLAPSDHLASDEQDGAQRPMAPQDGDALPYDAEDGSDYEQDGAGEGGDLEPAASGDAPLFGNWSSSSEGQSSSEVAQFLEFLAELLHDLKTSKSKMNVSTALALSNARVHDRRLCADPFFKHFFGISACGGQQRLSEVEADATFDGTFKTSSLDTIDELIDEDETVVGH